MKLSCLRKILIFTSILFLAEFNTMPVDAQHRGSRRTVTTSKQCGSCHKPVSKNSRIGMYCPHCGVRWGYENTTTRRSEGMGSTIPDRDWDFPSVPNFSGYDNTTCFCGRAKSRNEVMCYKCKTTCFCGRTKGPDEVMCYKCRTTCFCGRTKKADDVMCMKCKTTCSCGSYKNAYDVFCSSCKRKYNIRF